MKKIKKNMILLALLLGLSINMQAQSLGKVNAQQQKTMIEKINRTAASIKTIQANFTQVKSMSFLKEKLTATGRMYYDAQGKLRWEYLSPYQYTLVINNNKVYTKTGGKTTTIDINSSRLFQSIARIMVNSVTGKDLTSNADFTVRMYTHGADYVAYLTPKKAAMKKLYQSIRLYFDNSRNMVSLVEMIEKKGDKTTIDLRNVKINGAINEKVYSVN
jgi:outer membrane lipoprotein carrier protein